MGGQIDILTGITLALISLLDSVSMKITLCYRLCHETAQTKLSQKKFISDIGGSIKEQTKQVPNAAVDAGLLRIAVLEYKYGTVAD